MNHKLFLAATLSLLSLSACNPRSDITFNDTEFVSKDAVFFSTTTIGDFDGDGPDDSITSISLLIGEKEEPGEEPKDTCKLAALIGAANGDATSALGTKLIFIKANQIHLNQTSVPFAEGDFLAGGPFVDAAGNIIEGAATVTSVLKEKENFSFFNVLSEGFGTLHLQRLSEDSLNAEFVDTPFLLIREKEDGGFETVEEDSFLEGSIKRAKFCPALATFRTTFSLL